MHIQEGRGAVTPHRGQPRVAGGAGSEAGLGAAGGGNGAEQPPVQWGGGGAGLGRVWGRIRVSGGQWGEGAGGWGGSPGHRCAAGCWGN